MNTNLTENYFISPIINQQIADIIDAFFMYNIFYGR